MPGLELSLGRDAVPVRRGVPRLAPGTPLPAPAPMAIAVQSGGFAVALGLLGRPEVVPASVAHLARAAVETALGELRERAGSRARRVAVITDGKTARSAQA